jgi:hypothetical protein
MAYFRALLIFFFVCSSFGFAQLETPSQETSITVNALPIAAFETENPAQRNFGSLEFRGGFALSSTPKPIGGISGLSVQPDGEHFIALSDRATWLRGRIVYEGNRPVGISDAIVAPVLNLEGKPEPKWDTESIASDDGTLYVSLERIHSILRFEYGKKGLLAGGQLIQTPPELKDLPFNQGLEAMVFVPKKFRLAGTIIALSEQALTEEGNLKSFLIGGPTPGTFSVKRTDGYSISDAAILPGGDILILERQYSLDRGVSMRIRRIRIEDIKPGALVDGLAIIEAGAGYQVDNMEALSVHRGRSGEVILTLMSDDNFSPIQRTLLLQFALREK